MHFIRMIACTDAHTAGEPIRVVTSGFPPIYGRTMLEKRSYVMEHLDHCRKFLMREPRGHDGMYGAILTSPVTPDGDIGVLFMDNGGMGTMCGHGTIGVTKVLFETGMFPSQEGINTLKIDAPAGRVTAYADFRNGRVDSVFFHNVPSFMYRSDLEIPVAGVGGVLVDICFGGAFYIFVPAASLGLEIVPEMTTVIVKRAMEIRDTVGRVVETIHPTEPGINWIYGTVLTTPPEVCGDRVTTKNVCVFGESEVDRSPCGTGTSARMAQLSARGILKPGMTFENHSIIDTVFEGVITEKTNVADFDAIIPRISGNAYITGFTQMVLEPEDSLPEGFRLY